MQRWEYLHVQTNGVGNRWVPMMLDGVELRDWKKGVDIAHYVKQLGEQGWELVNAQSMGYGIFGYWFKRPKP